ncbi:acyl carrier protein [Streptomyces sp. DSM 15324]|uniref:acyl carrier protein n=1 Tax=Streptomyces sp. DSM 15324 TaxID=1739111 RepID=UPI000747CDE3|nr:phosphopantetheine-binding protein [Streptomyces sp. DSM 15324]KUO13118.1 actinorhodin polyketide synthase [Streptomyces sp. DSM 15324]
MSNRPFTIDDLKRILHASAGVPEGVDFDADILDVAFDGLGYESLALLETCGSIEREFGVSIDDDSMTITDTPRTLLRLVNDQLVAAGAP